jgi:hypothetical protein
MKNLLERNANYISRLEVIKQDIKDYLDSLDHGFRKLDDIDSLEKFIFLQKLKESHHER